MADRENSGSFTLPGGKVGVLMIHGFTGSPATVEPWARGIAREGFTVSVPQLAGHGTRWEDLNQTQWSDWYQSVESAYLQLRQECERVFIAGFSVGGALALRLVQNRGSEIEGLILLNASIFDERKSYVLLPVLKHIIPSLKSGAMDVKKPGVTRHSYTRLPLKALDSLRGLWDSVETDLFLVDLPLMVAYSVDDHVVDPRNSETIIDNVYSSDIREVIFENSFHNVSLDYDADVLIEESVIFIQDVLSGELSRGAVNDERELIDAEFEAIVSGLSLDESSPTTFLDELDRPQPDDFHTPNPPLPKLSESNRMALWLLTGGSLAILLYILTGFDLFGTGAWPGVFAICGGLGRIMWNTARRLDEGENGDDGAVL
ncbi:MAG: alpha/beta fold hydrolase [Actinomycetes bacterium]